MKAKSMLSKDGIIENDVDLDVPVIINSEVTKELLRVATAG